MGPQLEWRPGFILLAAAMLVGCTGPMSARTSGDGGQGGPRATKTLTIGVFGPVPGFALAANTFPTGGAFRTSEIHSDGLITADFSTRRPIARLAERVPSLDDGGVSVLGDGRMRVAFSLRRGVTWHDGVPFTAGDLVFSYQLAGPKGIPSQLQRTMMLVSSVEALDDYTFVMYFKAPYYQGAAGLGPTEFWPLPRHLLQPVYDRFAATGNAEEALQHRYWTSEYVHLGAFRLTQWEPGEGYSFEANDRYFLGRPRIDTIRVRILGDDNAVFTNALAGAVDLVPEFAVRGEVGTQLKKQWEQSGLGTVYVRESSLFHMPVQLRPQIQSEPANLDPRVRRALLHALDREAISDAVNGGNPQLAAWSFFPSDHPQYEVVKDGFRPFIFDPDRARAMLAEAGWTPGPDGLLHHSSDGRPYRTQVSGIDSRITAIASYWRAIGIQVEEFIPSPTQIPDREFRAGYPGWDATGADILDTMARPPAAAENRWLGSRNGYDNDRARSLIEALETTIAHRECEQLVRTIHDIVVSELAYLPLYYLATYIGRARHVKAFDDISGGGAFDPYGSYYRNSHLWDVQ